MAKVSNLKYHFQILIMVVILASLCIAVDPDKKQEYFITINGEQLHFIAQPELGYVVKSSKIKSTLSLDSNIQTMQNEDAEYLEVANRPDIKIIRSKHASDQNERKIRSLSSQSDTEYVAPLYILDGETVAIIPEIIVRLHHEAERSKLKELCLEVDCKIIKNLLYTEQEFLITPTARNAEEVLTTVKVFDSADFVEWAWPNMVFQPKLCNQPIADEPDRLEPNDEYFNKQWHLDAIRAPEAWFYMSNDLNKDTIGDPDIVIAVLDFGFDINQPDLANNIWKNPNEIIDGEDNDGNGLKDDLYGWNFVNDDKDVNPTDPNDAHGTACAGLIAAEGNNERGVTGVTWNCTIMPICILPSPAEECSTFTEPVDGLRYAAAHGADVISNSWSVNLDCIAIHSAIRDITQSGSIGRNGKGCVVFCASGNWEKGDLDYQVVYPAKYPEVIAVGAISPDNTVWDYSRRGPELDVVAPSGSKYLACDNLWTTDITGDKGYNNQNPITDDDPNRFDYTDNMNGTSGACPIAAGVAALILSIDPNLTTFEVQQILLHSARDLGPLNWDPEYGFGCVDAYEAVKMTLNPPEFILYVDANNPNDPNEDGSSKHPFDSIQEAIDNAAPGETVFVCPGTYSGDDNHDIDFKGKPITLKSKKGPQTCIIDCQKLGRGFIFHNEEGLYSTVEGFTIKNGAANSNGKVNGGGIYNYNSSPSIIDCTFTGNIAKYRGGGMYNNNSNPIIINCTFTENETTSSTYTDAGGGGMYNFESSPDVIDCAFTENTTNKSGGGIYNNDDSQLTITNCIFTGNTAGSGSGGGMYNKSSQLTVNNCTFTRNFATYKGDGIYCILCDLKMTNCIVWNNSLEQIVDNGSDIIISYSNIQGYWNGEGNIDVDPLFADPNNGDYHLKSEYGRWNPNTQTWVKDDVTSPCIDAGDPNSNFSGETWPHGGWINMGAYGGTCEASMSLEKDGMTLPNVAFIYSNRDEEAEDFVSLLESSGCSTTLIRLNDVQETPLDSYDILIIANDTQHDDTWSDPITISSIEDSNKPVIGLGDGGYDFFGLLGLWIGNPNGGHGSKNSIEVVDPNSSLFSTPYSIEIPENLILQLYTETNHVGLYLWPSIPESVTVFGREGSTVNYFPLAMEFNQYLLWGFNGSPQKMTEVGKTLFINVVIWTANEAWESNI
jgi:subtilisin family serine protease